MRVSKLYVICIRRQMPVTKEYMDPQFLAEARALALRSVILEKTGSASILDYAPCTYEGEGSAIELVNNPKRISEEVLYGEEGPGTRVGVYIIAHGSQEGMSGLRFDDISKILRECGIKKVDKFSLVSCGIGKDYEGSELPASWSLEGVSPNDFRNYLSRLCGFLGVGGYGNGDDGKIMVAGWKTYVTIAYPGRRETSELGKKTTKNESWKPFEANKKDDVSKMNSGRKYAQDKDGKKKPVHTMRTQANQACEAKVFYAWTHSKGLHPIQEAEWTDRRRSQ